MAVRVYHGGTEITEIASEPLRHEDTKKREIAAQSYFPSSLCIFVVLLSVSPWCTSLYVHHACPDLSLSSEGPQPRAARARPASAWRGIAAGSALCLGA